MKFNLGCIKQINYLLKVKKHEEKNKIVDGLKSSIQAKYVLNIKQRGGDDDLAQEKPA